MRIRRYGDQSEWRTLRHRGVALLIALVALIVTTSITVALARLAAIEQTNRSFDDAQLLSDDLLIACDAPIQQWLSDEATQEVLPEDAALPAIEILHHQWHDVNRQVFVRITAFDQLGMVRPEVLTSGSVLRLAVPDAVLQFVDGLPDEHLRVRGLDELVNAESRNLPLYPALDASEATWVGDGEPPYPTQHTASVPAQPALGGWLATHNPSPGVINVNTAPMPLVEQALRQSGRGGYELVAAAREMRKRVNVGDIPRVGDPSERAGRIVGSSDSWALRIDLQVGPLRRSWWAVYQRQSRGQWDCVQQHVIAE